ncbi:MAG: alcohol dehydrogenase catalytic domain-containing protein [Solirubrobacterales bacterium]
MSTMTAVTLHGPRDIRVEEVERPELQDADDVILRVEKTAICGSDLHPYHGRMEIEEGFVLGHEYLGIVEEAGDAVAQVQSGDRVVGSFLVCCGSCWFCRRGQQAKCIGVGVFGMGMAFGDLPGAQAQFLRVPRADLTLRTIPDGVSDEDGLFVGDILTTGYDAIRKTSMRPGDTVAVIGAGPVGLCAIMAAKALGAGQIVAIDMVAPRLEIAESLGAIPVNPSEQDADDVVLGLTDWRGADLVVDAVGHPSALAATFPLVRMGGEISVPGVYNEDEATVPIGDMWLKNVTIHTGIANIQGRMDEVMALVADGRLTPSTIISHRLGLSDSVSAYELFDSREALKVVLDPAS